jgi:uncharacterized protein
MKNDCPESELDPELVNRFADRMGMFHLSQRLLRETETFRDPYRYRDLEELIPLGSILKTLLKLSRLQSRGTANALNLETCENRVYFKRLPEAFEGFRLLHLTDMHFSGNPALLAVLLQALNKLEYDLCLFTGDYSPDYSDSPGLKVVFEQLRQVIGTEIFAVLGNHDSIYMVPWMEDMDITVLLNESVTVTRATSSITVAGVDDYHRFRLSSLEKALAGTEGEFVVLLNHSPEQYRQAAYAGVDLYLAGHTHGGQICLPNGFAPKLNIECGRQVGKGRWRFKQMQGYTSRGIGTSLVDVRFNCRPEIVIHELREGVPPTSAV